MPFPFYCVMNSGKPITDEMRGLLRDTAIDMAVSKQEKRRVSGGNFEGQIETKYDTVPIGGTTGIMFRADLDVGQTTTVVKFLVRPSEIPSNKGIWF